MIIQDGRSPLLQAAVRSFFVLILRDPAVNRKREQIEINGARRASRGRGPSFPRRFPQLLNISQNPDHDRTPNSPRELRGSIHTVSLKCAQSCPRADQIARRAVAPTPNRRQYGFDTWIARRSPCAGFHCRRARSRNTIAAGALKRSDTKADATTGETGNS